MQIPLSNRTIWLTGASSGMGFRLAEELLERGNTVVLTARNTGALVPLQERYPANAHVIGADVTDQESMNKLRDELGHACDSIDSIIINAGSCEYIDIDIANPDIDMDVIRRITDVNYIGAVNCIAIALPFLKQSRNSPHIVGISSAASFQGLPRSEAYGSSKAALRHFLQSLRLDLSSCGIEVSIVYPGFVDTPLTRKNDFPMPFIMTVDQAVAILIKQLEQRKLEISFPRRLIWPLRLLSMLPARISLWVGQKMVRSQPSSTDVIKEVSR